MKRCTKCGEEKDLSKFSKKTDSRDGYRSSCKKCEREYKEDNKERLSIANSEYRKNNKEKIKERDSIYYIKNKERISERSKEYNKKNKEKIAQDHRVYSKKNKEQIKNRRKDYRLKNEEKEKAQQKEYYLLNREHLIKEVTKYSTERKKRDVNYRITCNLRCRLHHALEHRSERKSKRTIELLGCTVQELIEHLENQFRDGMSWANYGINGWVIDHFIPCASFDLTDTEQQKRCFHFSNLKPLFVEENLRKGKKIVDLTDTWYFNKN